MTIAMFGLALALATPSSPIGGERAAVQTPHNRSFIVTCDCGTAAKRARIIAAVRRQGGTLLYEYRALGGLAVTAPKRGRLATFERRLRHVPGVIAVEPDGISHTTTSQVN